MEREEKISEVINEEMMSFIENFSRHPEQLIMNDKLKKEWLAEINAIPFDPPESGPMEDIKKYGSNISIGDLGGSCQVDVITDNDCEDNMFVFSASNPEKEGSTFTSTIFI